MAASMAVRGQRRYRFNRQNAKRLQNREDGMSNPLANRWAGWNTPQRVFASIAGFLVVVFLLGVIGRTISGSKSKSPVVTKAAAVHSVPAASPRAPAVSAPKPKPQVSQAVGDARSYIQAHGSDANSVQAYVQIVLIDVGNAQLGKGDINQIALHAQQAHDGIDSIRNDFADTAASGGALNNDETEVFVAANDMKNAMGALVAYSGNPNPATLAMFSTQYQTASSEWNQGIRGIWRTAGEHHPPTV